MPRDLAGRASPSVRSRTPEPKELVELAGYLAGARRCYPDPADSPNRRWELIVADETFEAWVIAWPPGGSIELHDHGGSRGAIAVRTGELLETSVAQSSFGRFETRSRRLRRGDALAMAEGYVHDVVNPGRTEAMSVHVYAPRLTSMTYYRLSDGTLEIAETVDWDLRDTLS